MTRGQNSKQSVWYSISSKDNGSQCLFEIFNLDYLSFTITLRALLHLVCTTSTFEFRPQEVLVRRDRYKVILVSMPIRITR